MAIVAFIRILQSLRQNVIEQLYEAEGEIVGVSRPPGGNIASKCSGCRRPPLPFVRLTIEVSTADRLLKSPIQMTRYHMLSRSCQAGIRDLLSRLPE